jgi:hypothetical protein
LAGSESDGGGQTGGRVSVTANVQGERGRLVSYEGREQAAIGGDDDDGDCNVRVVVGWLREVRE